MQKEVRPTKLKGPISVSHGTVESQKLHKFGNLFHCVPHPYKSRVIIPNHVQTKTNSEKDHFDPT